MPRKLNCERWGYNINGLDHLRIAMNRVAYEHVHYSIEDFLIDQRDECYQWNWMALLNPDSKEARDLIEEFTGRGWILDGCIGHDESETIFRFKSSSQFIQGRVCVSIMGHAGKVHLIIVHQCD